MASGKRKKKRQKKSGESFRTEVILWCVLAVSIILFISNFGVGGKVGNTLSAVCFGLFGLISYVFPICLFVGTAFVISNRHEKIAVVKLVASILFVIFLCCFVQMITNADNSYSASGAFRNGFYEKTGGGFLGGVVECILCPAFGIAGSYVITIIVLIISLVLITEKSFFKGMQTGSKKIYDTAKDDAVKRKEHHEKVLQKREEKKQLRMDRKAVGVALDTKINPETAEDLTINIDKFKSGEEESVPAVKSKKRIPLRAVGSDTNLTDNMSELHIQNSSAVQPAYSSQAALDSMEVEDEETNNEEELKPVRRQHSRQSVKEKETSLADITEEIAGKESAVSERKRKYFFPPVNLLKRGDRNRAGDSNQYLKETAMKLQQTLKTFGVNVTVTNVSCGPAVTRYELQPEMGVKVSKIVNLADDIKLNLAASDIRIEAPIPGKAAVGIEVPNKESIPVMFRELMESEELKNHPSSISFGAGKDISGKVIVADIAKMPHLLIAGATGSGKSVCINTIIMSILYRADPEDVKLIMIDPKVVELSVYNGIQHLLIPVVTDPKKAAGALNWAVQEMTERYQKFAQYNVRDIKGYNAKVENIKDIEDENKPQKMPQIVVIVDELADLMMVAPGDVEDAICRLAQLARACGIHLIIATQRPSVNVITGLIKANMPSRIAFSVTSGVDSRTILDMVGAEKLLGKGDMLFYPQGFSKPLRVQGAFVSDKEVQDVVNFITEHNGVTAYDSSIEEKMANIPSGNNTENGNSGSSGDERDAYFTDAAKLIIDKDKASIGMLQRYFKIGFNRAARIMDQLEDAGIVGPEAGTKPREIMMSEEQLENYIEEYE